MRRRVRTLAKYAAAVCVVAILALLALHSGPARRLAIERLSRALAAAGIELEAETLRFSLLTLSAEARNVRIRSVASPGLPAFATIGDIRLDVSLGDLVRGRSIVASGAADRVDIHYHRAADGRDNVPRTTAVGNEPRETLDYLLTRFTVTNVRARYEDLAHGVDVVVPVPAAEITGDAWSRRHTTTLESGRGQLRVGARTHAVDRVSGRLDIGRDAVRFEDWRITAAAAHLAFDGTLDLSQPSPALDVSSARVETDWGVVTGKGTLAFDRTRNSAWRVEFKNVDAATVMRSFNLPFVASSTIDGTLDATWPGLDYATASASSSAKLTPRKAAGVRAAPVGGDIWARFDRGAVVADVHTLTVAQTDASGRVSMTAGGRLEGHLRGNAPDIAATLATLEQLLGRSAGSMLPVAVAGGAGFDVQLAGRISAPDVVVTLAAPDLLITTADGLRVTGGVNGTVELTGRQRLDLAVSTDAVDVSTVFAAQQIDAPLTGSVTATAAVTGTVTRPVARLTVRGADFAAWGETLGTLTADATVAGRELTVSSLVFDKPQPNGNGRILGSGAYRLDRGTYTFHVTSENLQLLGLTIPGRPTIRGPLAIDATVTDGTATFTASAPDFNLEAKGRIALARPWTFDVAVRADAVALERLPLDMRGTATVTGTLRGSSASVVPDLVVIVQNGEWSRASNVQARARVAEGAVTVEQLTARWGEAAISGSGVVPLALLPALPVEIPRSSGAMTFTGEVRGLALRDVPGVPAGLTGSIDADVSLSAPRADVAAVEGEITLPRLEIAASAFALNQPSPSKIRIAGGLAHVDRLTLAGSAGTLTATGTVGLAGTRPLGIDLAGALNLAALSTFTTAIRADGLATVNVRARGTVTAPELSGGVTLADAAFAADALDVVATHVNAQLAVAGTRIELQALDGQINGGTLSGSGQATLAEGTLTGVDLQVSAKDVAYDAPLDMRSLSDIALRLSSRGDELLLSGQVTLKEAGITSDVSFDDDMFAAVRAPRTVDLGRKKDAFLERLQLSIDIDTAVPVTIDNELARAELDADLRLVGTPRDAGLTGRLTLAEGGHVTLNARRYEIERGVITFVDERRVVPSIDLVLNTNASNYDVRITVTGTPGKTDTSWTSEPPLSEPDIMALVVTGRTVDQMRGQESEVARVQALSYLTGRVGSKFGGGLERATGISEVRIEPVLIANETDPTARLTVGQNITDQVKLIYSTNLTDSNDQIWVAEYDVTRRFQIRAVREREDDSYRGDFRHDVRFGGEPAPRRQSAHRPAIASLSIAADGQGDEATLRRLFELEEGEAYEYFAARSGVERIEQHYLEAGYLQSRVRLDRETRGDAVSLSLRATRGPLVILRVEGASPSSDVQRDMREAWHRGVFDTQRLRDSTRALRDWLLADRYLQAKIEPTLEDRDGRRHVVYRVQPGPRSEKVVVVFENRGTPSGNPVAQDLSPAVDCRSTVLREGKKRGIELELFTAPSVVVAAIQRCYQAQGFLSAEIAPPRYEFDGTQARVVIAVREGPRFQVRRIGITGNTVYPSREILAALSLAPGTPFVSAGAELTIDQVRGLYWPKGYNDVRSEYALVVDRDAAAVDVELTITEGRQSIVTEIAVQGNRKTSERLVRGQVELAPTQPLDLSVLARSRRNLYRTGAFSIADITREDIEGSSDSMQKKVRLNVAVREVQPIQLRYGLSYDTEGGLGGILDFSVHNSLGKARVFGVQGRYDSEIHEARVYVSQPSLRTWPRKTTASVYFREDLNPPTDQTDPFDISRQGGSIQQEMHFRTAYIWSYGYRYELATTLEPSLGEGATETVRVTPLSGTLTRETRDEVLDASKGTFLSQALAYSPSWLGSDRPYVKYYGQYFFYFPLREAQPKPFSTEAVRPRLVFATGVRLGLSRGIGGEVPTSERFYAGGSTTLRGFEQNAVGPVGANNVPAGGTAVIVFNNELRVPVLRRLDGVLFVDVGNVYPTITDFSLADLRESAGVGIRVRTPWVLLRSDYGFILDLRPGERRGRFYISIGQAF